MDGNGGNRPSVGEAPLVLDFRPSYSDSEQEDINQATSDYYDCLSSKGYIVEPFRLNTGQFGVTHEITDDEGSTLGSKALKLTLDPASSSVDDLLAPGSKLFVEYFEESVYNEPVSGLTRIEIDFKWEGVAGTTCGNIDCYNQIYVGVYTRSDAGDEVFYDCQLTFSVAPLGAPAVQNLDGGSLGFRGDWHRHNLARYNGYEYSR